MIFLKLGGSLITDKSRERTVRQPVLERLANEIASYFKSQEAKPLLLGHGSGSFGHIAAARHQTHRGAASAEDWIGFAEVWQAAAELNKLVIQSLRQMGLPALSLPPSASAICHGGEIVELAVEPIAQALKADLLPVVYGDVAFDRRQGAAIMSTESIFAYLIDQLKPSMILLAGLEAGVYADYPTRQQLITELGPSQRQDLKLAGAEQTDVTGGMMDKVDFALAIKASQPGVKVQIFSGDEPGAVLSALSGEPIGTLITTD